MLTALPPRALLTAAAAALYFSIFHSSIHLPIHLSVHLLFDAISPNLIEYCREVLRQTDTDVLHPKGRRPHLLRRPKDTR